MSAVPEPVELVGAQVQGLSPEAVSAAVVRLVETLTYSHRVRALDEADIMLGRGRDSFDLRIAARREHTAAEHDLTELVGAVDHERALALIRALGVAQAEAEDRAEQDYLELPASAATS